MTRTIKHAKPVINRNVQDETKASEDYIQYQADYIEVLLDLETMCHGL